MKKKVIPFILSTLLISVAFTSIYNGYEPGSEAMDFKLKNIDGHKVSMGNYKEAKGFIVVFTCNHCPYAKKYQDRIIALDKKYKPLGYPVIAINPNDTINYPEDSFKEMVKRAKEKKYTFPYLIDETQEVAKTYGATKTPDIFLIKKEKDKLIVMYKGAIDNNFENAKEVTKKYLENALDELLAGKEVTVKSTKAVGCSIKWVE